MDIFGVAILWHILGERPAMLLGAGTVILIRWLSYHFRWNLPKAHDEKRRPKGRLFHRSAIFIFSTSPAVENFLRHTL